MCQVILEMISKELNFTDLIIKHHFYQSGTKKKTWTIVYTNVSYILHFFLKGLSHLLPNLVFMTHRNRAITAIHIRGLGPHGPTRWGCG